jgi:hypothetical protein
MNIRLGIRKPFPSCDRLPERYQEFVDQYRLDKRNDKEISILTYTISDYLIGVGVTRGPMKEEVVNPRSAFLMKFEHQLSILGSCVARIDSVLSDIVGMLQEQLFDDEPSAAKELLKKGHRRAAGARAGVTIERHFFHCRWQAHTQDAEERPNNW